MYLFFIGCSSHITLDKIDESTQNISKSTAEKYIQRGDELYNDPKSIDKVKQALKYYEQVIHSKQINLEACWKGSMACAYISENSGNEDLQSQYAKKGLTYSDRGIQISSKSPESHYYYAVNLGLYAEVHSFDALGLIPKMEEHAHRVIQLNPSLDYAGAYRLLGNLYYKAPAVISVGDKKKGLFYLKKACEIAPDYPPNLLDYSEVLIDSDKKSLAKKYIDQVLRLKKSPSENNLLPKWKKKARKLLKKMG